MNQTKIQFNFGVYIILWRFVYPQEPSVRGQRNVRSRFGFSSSVAWSKRNHEIDRVIKDDVRVTIRCLQHKTIRQHKTAVDWRVELADKPKTKKITRTQMRFERTTTSEKSAGTTGGGACCLNNYWYWAYVIFFLDFGVYGMSEFNNSLKACAPELSNRHCPSYVS